MSNKGKDGEGDEEDGVIDSITCSEGMLLITMIVHIIQKRLI